MTNNLAPFPNDGYPTETSELQADTEAELLCHLPNDALPELNKRAHVQYVARALTQGFPPRYTSQDASQPWLLNWSLQSLAVLGVAIDNTMKQRAIDTIMAWQHPDGGFGGGPGQAAHLLPTYAATCALALVGRPGPGGGWDQVDRQKMYSFFMSLKQDDGSFLVAHHGEVDVRGTYCLVVAAHLLDILTPELLSNVPRFISACQTYEGGFACAAHASYASGSHEPIGSFRPPLGEAHGGYTFCALAVWAMLKPHLSTLGDENVSINTRSLMRWIAGMQGTQTELGGMKGRTNKLVDGCYAWWVGAEVGIVQAVHSAGAITQAKTAHTPGTESESEWVDAEDSIIDRTALQTYILCAGQHPAGGLRDKPPKSADSYHTLYCLAGLSSAQHSVAPHSSRRAQLLEAWVDRTEDTADALQAIRKTAFIESLSWTADEAAEIYVGGKENRLNATLPLFNLTTTHTEGIMAHFYKQKIPPIPRRKPAARSSKS